MKGYKISSIFFFLITFILLPGCKSNVNEKEIEKSDSAIRKNDLESFVLSQMFSAGSQDTSFNKIFLVEDTLLINDLKLSVYGVSSFKCPECLRFIVLENLETKFKSIVPCIGNLSRVYNSDFAEVLLLNNEIDFSYGLKGIENYLNYFIASENLLKIDRLSFDKLLRFYILFNSHVNPKTSNLITVSSEKELDTVIADYIKVKTEVVKGRNQSLKSNIFIDNIKTVIKKKYQQKNSLIFYDGSNIHIFEFMSPCVNIFHDFKKCNNEIVLKNYIVSLNYIVY